MNILLINHYAGSRRHGMEYRPFYLAREWVRLGHRVQIIAASWSHVRSVQPAEPGDEVIDGIAYRWLATPPYGGNGVGRVLNIWAFLKRLWRDAPQWASEFRPDAVIASSTYPMDIWVARRIARLAGAKLVHEVHDLWPASPIELSGMSPRHPFILLCQKAENDACRDADVVVSMLPKVAEHLQLRGLDLRKLHIVPNGISPEEWQGAAASLAPAIATHIAQQRAAGRQVVVYAGSHGEPNALDVLLDAAAALRTEPFAFVLVGDGHEKARLAQRVQVEGEALRHVCLFEPIPKAQIPALLAAADIAYIGWKRQPLYRFGIAPNKLMDYMMAGVPVLHSVEAGNDPVAEAGCGLTVAPESAQAVAQRPAPAGRVVARRAPRDGRTRTRLRARPPRLPGTRAALPGGHCMTQPHDEADAVTQRYARRDAVDGRYSLLRPEVWQTVQERQRAMLSLFVKHGLSDLAALRLLEVGCGSGGNLLELLRLGFRPEHLAGAELLPERLAAARATLPAATALHGGDATALVLEAQSQDIVFVSTVFSSLLDDAFQQRLAETMWRWVRPGGGVLWYDFTVDNPKPTATCAACRWRVCGSCSRRAASMRGASRSRRRSPAASPGCTRPSTLCSTPFRRCAPTCSPGSPSPICPDEHRPRPALPALRPARHR